MAKRQSKRDRKFSKPTDASVSAGTIAPTDEGSRHRAILTLTIIFWLMCSVALTVLIPRGDAPDEAAHLDYVSHLARTWDFGDFRTESRGTERHQPPLYYLICALVHLATGGSLIAVRLISTLCGVALILITFNLARAWRPGASFFFHWACAAVVGFLPMNLYMCSAANNDPLVNVLVAAGLLHFWSTRNSEHPVRDAAITGAIAGLAMLSKSTALAIVAAAGLWFLLPVFNPAVRRVSLLRLAAFIGAFFVVFGPWAVRNTIMYGDPLAASSFYTVLADCARPDDLGGLGPNYWLVYVLPFAWMTFFGAYDHLIHPDDFMPGMWYLLFIPVVLAAAVWGVGRLRSAWETSALRPLILCVLAGAFTLLAGFINFNCTVFQGQARYFFAYLPVAIIAICTGIDVMPRYRRGVGYALLLALIAWGVLEGIGWRMWFVAPQ